MDLFQLLVYLTIFALSVGSLSYQEIEKSFQHNLNILETYISRGLCQHFYIDMGTNIGIQLRKLYEPHYFPEAQALPTFDTYFGNEKAANNRTRSNVCSIGFEPNHVHFDRLNSLQNKYRMAGYPMVIFMGAAVWVENKKLTFYERPQQDHNETNEWGSSLLPYAKDMMKQEVLGIEFSAFFVHIFELWKKQFPQELPSPCFAQDHTGNPSVVLGKCSEYITSKGKQHKILGKLDIEGAEYTVIPHLLANNVLCYFDAIMIEFHKAG
jgi:hypothetical protein